MKITKATIAALCAAAVGIAADAKTTHREVPLPGGQASITVETPGDEEPNVEIHAGETDGDAGIMAEFERMEQEMDRQFERMNRRFGFGPGFGSRPFGPGFRRGFGGRGFGGRPGNFRREEFTCPHCGAKIASESWSDRRVFKDGVEVKDDEGQEARKPGEGRDRRDFRRGPAGKRGFGKGPNGRKPECGKDSDGRKPECGKGKPCDGNDPKPECGNARPDGRKPECGKSCPKGRKPECGKGKPCDGNGPKPECGKKRRGMKKQARPLPPPAETEDED